MRRALAACLLAACSLTPASSAPQPARGAPQPPPAPAQPDAGLAYVVRLTGGARDGARLPMVVALHGLGDAPDDFVTLFDGLGVPARVVALRAPRPWGGGFAWFPPGDADRDAASFRRAVDAVAAALPALTTRFPTCGLPVLTGFSQGGMLAFAVAGLSPSVVRAAVPIAGRLPSAFVPPQRPVGGVLPEVLALHGTADARIEFARGEAAVRALAAVGFPATMRPFEGVGHAIPMGMRAELYTTLARLCRGC